MTIVSDAYRDCFMYVDSENPDGLRSALAHRLGATPDRRTVPLRNVELDVLRNDGRLGRSDDFVDWGTRVEVYASTMPDSEVVRFVSDLMVFLRSLGHRVVAACDFEDELPQTDFR